MPERSEPARERRIALYKSDQQQQQAKSKSMIEIGQHKDGEHYVLGCELAP